MTKSEKVGEDFSENPTLGEAKETKEYMTFANEDMYMMAVGQIMNSYCNRYIKAAYEDIATAEDEYDTVQYFKAKKGDTYKLSFSTNDFAFEEYGDYSYFYKNVENTSITFNSQGITGMNTEMDGAATTMSQKATMSYTISYSSDKAAVSDPFTGYEKAISLNYYNAVVYPNAY